MAKSFEKPAGKRLGPKAKRLEPEACFSHLAKQNFARPRKTLVLPGGFLQKAKRLRISLVLASKDEEIFAKGFFESVKRQTRRPDEIILVDSSKDKTAKIAKKIIPSIRLYRTRPVSAGFQRQFGFEKSTGDVILFTDVDAIADKRWVEEMEKAFLDDRVNAAVGTVQFKEIPEIIPPEKGRYYMNHCNAGYRRNVLEEFPVDAEQNWDDKDLGYRVGKKHLIYGVPEARVFHIGTFHDLLYTEKKFGEAMAKLLKKYSWHPFWICRWLYNLAIILFIRRNIRQFFYCIYGMLSGIRKVYFG